MPVISIFNGLYCNGMRTTRKLATILECQLYTDHDLALSAARMSGLDEEKILRAFTGKTSVFNQFTFEKERAIAYLRHAMAKIMQTDNVIVHGFCSHLLPQNLSNVLKICLTASQEQRLNNAETYLKLTRNEAAAVLTRDEADRSLWTNLLYSEKNSCCSRLYDLVIDMEGKRAEDAVAMIKEKLASTSRNSTEHFHLDTQDFLTQTLVQTCLMDAGHNVGVHVRQGLVTLTINRKVLMLERLEKELKEITLQISGVRDVETRLNAETADNTLVYRKHNDSMPSRLLLVDDEKEFVQTLSERLQMREMGAVIAYDGESALNLVRSDEPEVMIIDLKMPGMDGMDLLKEVKQFRPEIEVIVLTGHGSEEERQSAMKLGAFDYMNKPVDINMLSSSLQKAHQKIRAAG